MAPQMRPASQRFWPKVILGQTEDDCWLWAASRTSDGYGRFLGSDRRMTRAHRFAYESQVGPIPPGMTLDHLCRKRECVNPRHLEPVPNHENLLRGEPANRTHCPAGHEYTPANTHLWNGKRKCRECGRVRAASRRAVLRERARIVVAVEGLPRLWDANVPIGDDPWEACRAAVLAIVGDKP